MISIQLIYEHCKQCKLVVDKILCMINEGGSMATTFDIKMVVKSNVIEIVF